MGSAFVDYILTAGIKQRLQFLSENPHHLYYIFEELYCNKNIRDIVGERYIKEAVECIISQRMQVGPAYNIDQQKLPSIVVISSSAEDQQYIGDYGLSQVQKVCPPTIYDTFDATSLRPNNDLNALTTSMDYKLIDKLWHGIFIANGTFSSQLDYAIDDSETNTTTIVLKDPIPIDLITLKGWVSASDDQYRGVVYSSSTEAITSSITLTNSGSYAQHYIYTAVLRYILKSQRMFWDANGLQVSTQSNSIPVIMDQEDQIFQSQFTLQGKYTETWIDHEFMLPNKGAKYNFCMTVEPSNPQDEAFCLDCPDDDA